MVKTIKGLVLREVPYKESSRILTVLSDTDGKIVVQANGAKRRGSKTAAGSQILAYSEMTLSETKGRWYLNEASTIELFEELRTDMKALSLGMYFAEVLETAASESLPDPDMLRLGLNCLYFLSRKTYPEIHVKTAFELKLMCLAGYEPLLDGCCACGLEDPGRPWFDTEGGTLCCDTCRGALPGAKTELCEDSLKAMRHLLASESASSFAFSLPDDAMKRLAAASEKYVSKCMERHFGTLDYYYKLEF